jgi:uncharacterized membrane protein
MFFSMPDLAPLHPQIVHFAVALCFVGVAFRWLSLTNRVPFAGPAAATLVLLGTVAAVLAAQSGLDAHGPVERIPGVRAAVQAHEAWGLRTRNVFLAVAALEVLGLALARVRPAWRRWAEIGSAIVGLAGGFSLYEASEHGGELVYSYAGGVGIRSGDTTDIQRLLVAGLYEQALVDRAQRRSAEAAGLIEELARRAPGDTGVLLLLIESQILDRHDPQGALAALERLTLPADNQRLRVQAGMLAADALVAAESPDSARALLRRLVTQFPMSQRLKDRLAQLGG